MPISDPRYVLLIVLVALAFYALPARRPRVLFILCASYAYYLTFPVAFLASLLFVTIVAFVGGLLIERARESRAMRWATALALVTCVAPMLSYKYLIPLSERLGFAAAPAWVLPVGLSFYTFAAAGYLADVALGIVDAERRPARLALFCAFFPTVTMGPVMRTSLFEQLEFDRTFNVERGLRAGTEILLGMVLKLWFADTIAVSANEIYGNLQNTTPVEHFFGSALVAFQVYADWLGYSMIAIGSARLLGVDLPVNFRQPFLSPTINEFWRRWNISLINWLRDYLFMPIRLKLKLLGPWAVPLATTITFAILGMWHAAGWGYLVYGLANGLLVVGSQLTLPLRDKLWRSIGCPPWISQFVRIPITFCIVVLTVPLVRASDFGEAIEIYQGIFSIRFLNGLWSIVRDAGRGAIEALLRSEHMMTAVLLILCLIAYDIISSSKIRILASRPGLVTATVYATCILAVIYYAASGAPVQPFVYFHY